MSWRLLLAIVLPLHALTWWGWLGSHSAGFPLDDAWIHMVYARALAALEGLHYNPGEAQTGVSAPLWTALLALPVGIAERFGARPDLGVRLLASLVSVATAFAGARLAARAGRLAGLIAAILLSVDPWMVFDRFAGMEAPLFALLLFGFVAALADGRSARAGWLGGALLLTRPEAAVLVLAGAIWLQRRKLRVTLFLLPALLPWALWALWCWQVSGRAWPSTFDSKLGLETDAAAHARVLAALLSDLGWGLAPLLLAPYGAWLLERNGNTRGSGLCLLGAALLLVVGVLLSRGMQLGDDPARVPYYWSRYALLAWPLLLVLSSIGLAGQLRSASAGLRCKPVAGAFLIAPLALTLVLARSLPAHALHLPARFAAECAELELLHVTAGHWIDEHLPPDALVATHDAGALRYFGRRRVLDIWGNHAHELNRVHREARARDGDDVAQQAALRWLTRQQPDALVVFPMLFAVSQASELDTLWRDGELTRGEYDMRRAAGSDYAQLFGLTQRVATFHVDDPVIIPDPAHADLAVFVAP
ncbi:MAG: hypothetical protein DHS20C15_14890 [Planctomycetota bacterium]|nr:MAG: hypothetical protein DHS20C15_14890 [Planctomycetota bacterium]